MALLDRPYTTFYWSTTVNMVCLSCTTFELFDDLKSLLEATEAYSDWYVPFERLGAVSYSPSIVTMAVSLIVYEILSVKKMRDLENWVRGCSRSLKMAPFGRPLRLSINPPL